MLHLRMYILKHEFACLAHNYNDLTGQAALVHDTQFPIYMRQLRSRTQFSCNINPLLQLPIHVPIS